MNPVLEPEILTNDGQTGDRWALVIFNNPVTTFEAVITTLMTATGCDEEEAFIEAWEAHHFGQAPVHFDPDPESLHAPARAMNGIGVKTEIRPEFLP